MLRVHHFDSSAHLWPMNHDHETGAEKAASAAGAFVLGVDLDGVCADYSSAFRSFVARDLGIDPSTMGPQNHWEFFECEGWGVRDTAHYVDLHRRAVLDEHMFAAMPEIEGASDALWQLSDAGVYIRIITHRLTVNWGHSKAVADTTEWLQQPRSDGRPRIPYRDICFCAAKADVGADLYIDDAPHNVLALRRARRDVVCFDAPYNRDVRGKRATNWAEVVELVTKTLEDQGLA